MASHFVRICKARIDNAITVFLIFVALIAFVFFVMRDVFSKMKEK